MTVFSLATLGLAAAASVAASALDPVSEATNAGQSVELRFTNVEPEAGTLWVSVCTQSELVARDRGEPDACTASDRIAAVNGARIRFDNLRSGDYAFTAFHDDNDNGELDFDNRGIPFEATGNARNARGNYGPPTFEQMRVTVDALQNSSEVTRFTVRMYKPNLDF